MDATVNTVQYKGENGGIPFEITVPTPHTVLVNGQDSVKVYIYFGLKGKMLLKIYRLMFYVFQIYVYTCMKIVVKRQCQYITVVVYFVF